MLASVFVSHEGIEMRSSPNRLKSIKTGRLLLLPLLLLPGRVVVLLELAPLPRQSPVDRALAEPDAASVLSAPCEPVLNRRLPEDKAGSSAIAGDGTAGVVGLILLPVGRAAERGPCDMASRPLTIRARF